MRFDGEDYQRAALERLDEARILFMSRRFVGCHYICGIAIEATLRAYLHRVRPDFAPTHNLLDLGEAFLGALPERHRPAMTEAIAEAAILWRNNHRYCDAKRLVAYLNRAARYVRARDMLRQNAETMLGLAQIIVARGEDRWRR